MNARTLAVCSRALVLAVLAVVTSGCARSWTAPLVGFNFQSGSFPVTPSRFSVSHTDTGKFTVIMETREYWDSSGNAYVGTIGDNYTYGPSSSGGSHPMWVKNFESHLVDGYEHFWGTVEGDLQNSSGQRQSHFVLELWSEQPSDGALDASSNSNWQKLFPLK